MAVDLQPTPDVTADELLTALERREFALHYQPIVAARSHRLVALEALVRWHRLGTVVGPDAFLPDIERFGLQHRLAAQVFIPGLRDLERLRAERAVSADVRLHVNVSPAQLDDECRIDEVMTCTRRLGVPYDALTIELTESGALGNPDLANRMLGRCRALGVPIAVDDVGVGYSSLALLKTVEFDELKIDRSFVADVEHDPASQAVIAGIVAIARRLGLVTTAEGVERHGQADVLRDLDVDRLQGFLYGVPRPVEQLVGALRAPLASARRRHAPR